MKFLPKVMPISELKNIENISRVCKESTVPIILTKNGYGDMVLMNVALYESLIEEINTIKLLNDPKREEKRQDFNEFMDELIEERNEK